MTIETERLILREFNENDFSRMYEYQNDSRYLEFYEYNEKSEEEVLRLLNMIISWKNEKPRIKYLLCIELRSTGTMIGNCGIRLNSAGDNEGEIGFELDPKYWKYGYMSEALKSILEYGKKNIGLSVIRAYCHPENTNAIKVIMNLGFKIIRKINSMERKREEIELEYKM
jgi:RimJ/RimL family protein N-acetyltransferase